MPHAIDSLTLEELSFDLKEVLVKVASLANFVDEPQIFLVFD